MKVLACPGQGSQSQGFLKPWIEEVSGFQKSIEELSEYCGLDLIELGTLADEETIKATEIAQPLIVGSALATYLSTLADSGFEGVVGHSVGEYAAAAIAGVISPKEAMELVTVRGAEMARAAAENQTSMAAVIGADQAAIQKGVEDLGLKIANYNGGQFVAAGLKSQISELIANPPAGTRVIELKVAGAFHTEYMQSAIPKLLEKAKDIIPRNPKMNIWSNADGKQVLDGQIMLNSLVSQVAKPVRWDLCMESLTGIEKFVELPPAGALSGLAKRGIPNVEVVALKLPADISKAG